MTTLVDTDLLSDLQRYGAADVSACFSCGNCTATCPLVSNDATFPRRMIRYAQVGLRDQLLSSKELWTCYACGECSETCPTQAEPSEFMAAARRYAIAGYDRTGLARTMYTRPLVGTLFAVALAAFFALFMYAGHGPQSAGSLDIFGFIPEELIHNLGIGGDGRGLRGRSGRCRDDGPGGRRAPAASPCARPSAVEPRWVDRPAPCGAPSPSRRSASVATATTVTRMRPLRPWYLRRWFLHAATMWGFLGLLAATILDYGLALAGIKETGTPVPIWYPVRLLGTVAGILLVYGATMLIVQRFRGRERSVRHSTAADWTLLALIWITGVTGFALEVALYLPSAPPGATGSSCSTSRWRWSW